MTTGQRQPHGDTEWDRSGEGEGRILDCLTKRDMRVKEPRVRRTQGNIAVRHELEPASGTDSIYCGNDRLGDLLMPRREVHVVPRI